jgi:hypothetical protein
MAADEDDYGQQQSTMGTGGFRVVYFLFAAYFSAVRYRSSPFRFLMGLRGFAVFRYPINK